MPRRPDARIQWTLKGPFDAEFMALVKKAAERQGQTIVAFVADTLRERAQAILKKQDDDTPQDTPQPNLPALLIMEDIGKRFENALTNQKTELEKSFSEAIRLQQDQIMALARENRRGKWRR